MKKVLYLLTVAVLFFSCGCLENTKKSEKPVLRHIAIFQFAPEATDEDVDFFENAFEMMAVKIDAIKDFEYGSVLGLDSRNDGFSHCFVMAFDNEAGLTEYQNHPLHNRLKSQTEKFVKQALIFNYYVQK